MFEPYTTLDNSQIKQTEAVKKLLQPRYKVIASYPYADCRIGDIINPVSRIKIELYESFPHLFRKLEWWEERVIDQMPTYLIDKTNNRIVRVDYYNDFEVFIDGSADWIKDYLPCTEWEYNNYLQKKL